ncbi:bifunctional phosphoglucose/phosphomannose isomerase, partial [Candidatus Bathyarchaeota archaeon]|nr:bifunctional phosphoglucose/phosphomannose isomerase [Candidatus Bathyarchaeota archaeon]
EEALSMLLDALKKKCMIFFISSNDKNLALAEKLRVPCIKVSSGIPPRAALPYLSLPMFKILEKLNLISKVDEEIDETIKVLKHVCAENSPEKPLKNNFSKSLALKINGTIPIVYGFGIYRAVAQRYKQQFNENSKIPSGWDFFPELNHNEIMGWEKAGKLAEDFSLILIRDKNEPDYLRLRIEVTKELMPEELRENTFEVFSQGASELAKMFSTIYIGDFTSVYLAILRGVDPTPVKSISILKEKITVSGVKNQIIKEFENL